MLFKKLLPLYNVTMERLISASRFSGSEEAQFRLRVVDFSKKCSIKAAADASGVSRQRYSVEEVFKRIPGSP